MALGQIRDGKKVVFEGDFKLLDFKVHPKTSEFPYEWASYQLLTLSEDKPQVINLSGWIDSGCDKLKLGGIYHFYFDYSSYNGKTRVQVIGCNPNIITDLKIVDKPLELEI